MPDEAQQIPDIPKLTGPLTHRRWVHGVLRTLTALKLDQYVRLHAALHYVEPGYVREAEKEQALAMRLIVESVSRVRDWLAVEGWDFSDQSKEPWQLFEFVQYKFNPDFRDVGW